MLSKLVAKYLSIIGDSMCTFQLKDKRILVTGAEGYLGKFISNALALEGAKIYKLDKRGSQFNMDIAGSIKFDCPDLLNVLEQGLDGLVNNAAISYKGYDFGAYNTNPTMMTNVTGTERMTQIAASHMKDGGTIVNVASIYGMFSPDPRIYNGDPELFSSASYGASKAAIIQMTKYYAVMLADKNIRVNAVSPGGIYQDHKPEFNKLYSDRVPMKRMARPEEIANAILYLLSPLSSYITGQNLAVDGGLSAW